jgi:hypothetical protein
MIAIWMGLFVFVQALVLIFVLGLCKSTAQADREFEWAWLAEQTLSNDSEQIKRN